MFGTLQTRTLHFIAGWLACYSASSFYRHVAVDTSPTYHYHFESPYAYSESLSTRHRSLLSRRRSSGPAVDSFEAEDHTDLYTVKRDRDQAWAVSMALLTPDAGAGVKDIEDLISTEEDRKELGKLVSKQTARIEEEVMLKEQQEKQAKKNRKERIKRDKLREGEVDQRDQSLLEEYTGQIEDITVKLQEYMDFINAKANSEKSWYSHHGDMTGAKRQSYLANRTAAATVYKKATQAQAQLSKAQKAAAEAKKAAMESIEQLQAETERAKQQVLGAYSEREQQVQQQVALKRAEAELLQREMEAKKNVTKGLEAQVEALREEMHTSEAVIAESVVREGRVQELLQELGKAQNEKKVAKEELVAARRQAKAERARAEAAIKQAQLEQDRAKLLHEAAMATKMSQLADNGCFMA